MNSSFERFIIVIFIRVLLIEFIPGPLMHKNSWIIPSVAVAIIIIASVILLGISSLPGPGGTPLPAQTPLPPLPREALPLSERLNSTDLLLREPVGGFRGGLAWLTGPDTIAYDYVFYSRDYGPGNVSLSVYEVSSPLNSTPIRPAAGISARMVPDRFSVEPGTNSTAQLVVTVSPEGYSHDPVTRTFYVHADAEGEKNAITDDWIRLQMADRPTTYLSYQTRAEMREPEISLHRGERWAGNLSVRLGERGTGPVHIWTEELDCGTLEFSSLDTPQPPKQGSPVIAIDPGRFIGRSFGTYELGTLITTGKPTADPGTYCYEITVDAPDVSTSFSTKVHVIP